jgi:serine/threonine protein kinase
MNTKPDSGTTSLQGTDSATDRKPVRVRDLPENAEALHGLLDTRTVASLLEELPPGLLTGDRFTLKGVLGRGAQGVVLRLFDRDCGREIALKLPRQRQPPARKLARFIREAQIQAQLEHPGIIPVHDIMVLPDRTIGYVMRSINGDDLRTWAHKHPEATIFDRLTIFLTACDCLAYAHGKGVIHRDLKPQNILVGDYGQVLICDWGLAKVTAIDDIVISDDSLPLANPDFTNEGLAVGTPAFMSPEQAAGDSHIVDERSDIYSLGVILYELLTGQSPYAAIPIEESLIAVVERGNFPQPSTIKRKDGSTAPAPLMAIVDRAMSYRPRERYENVAALIKDLRRYLSGLSVEAYNEPPWEGIYRMWRNHRTAALTGLGVFVAAIIAGGAMLSLNAQRNAERAATLKEQALLAEARGDYTTARDQWMRYRELFPNSTEAIEKSQECALKFEQATERAKELAQLEAVIAQCEDRLVKAERDLTANDPTLLPQIGRYLDQSFSLLPGITGYEEIDTRIANLRERLQEALSLRETRSTEAEQARLQAQMSVLLTAAKEALDNAALDEAEQLLEQAAMLPIQSSALRVLQNKLQEAQVAQATAKRHADALVALNRARDQLAAHSFVAATALAQESLNLHATGAALELLQSIEPRRQAWLEQQDRDRADALIERFLLHMSRPDWQRASAGALLDEAGRIYPKHPQLPLLWQQLDSQDNQRKREQVSAIMAQHDKVRDQPASTRYLLLREAEHILPNHPPTRRELADFHHEQLQKHVRDGNENAARISAAQGKEYDDDQRYELAFAYEGELRIEGDTAGWTFESADTADIHALSPLQAITAGRCILRHELDTAIALRVYPGERRTVQLPPGLPAKTIGTTRVIPVAFGQDVVYFSEREVTGEEYLTFLNDPQIRAMIDDRDTTGMILAPRTSIDDEDGLWPRKRGVLRTLGEFTPDVVDRRRPIRCISYQDVTTYIAWRQRRDGIAWRLPTHNEWQLAAGNQDGSQFPTGADIDLKNIASAHNSSKGLPAAGSFQADRSSTGLLDMAGSVSEWTSTKADLLEPIRVVCGGHWQALQPTLFRTNYQTGVDERLVEQWLGFRLVVDVVDGQPKTLNR